MLSTGSSHVSDMEHRSRYCADLQEAEQKSEDAFNSSVNASGKQRVLLSLEPELFENLGRVVVDSLNTGEGLEEDETHSEENTVTVTR